MCEREGTKKRRRWAGAAQQDGGSSDAGACKRIMQASSAKQGWQAGTIGTSLAESGEGKSAGQVQTAFLFFGHLSLARGL